VKRILSVHSSRLEAENEERRLIDESLPDPLCMNSPKTGTVCESDKTVPFSGGNSPVFPVKQSRFSAQTVPKTGHGYVSDTSEEPSGNRKNKRDTISYDSWPCLPDEQILADWHAMRKRQRANVSQTVANAFGKELVKAGAMGFTVNDCLTMCVMRNWRGFEAEWMRNAKASLGGGFKTKQQISDERSRAAVDEFVGGGRVIEGEIA
jgi:hypothetical protein